MLRKFQRIIIALISFFYTPFKKLIPPETFRYAFTGGGNTLFDIGLYFLFYNYILDKQIIEIGFIAISPHIAAFLCVFPITFLSGFLLAKYITFTSSELKGRVQIFRYGLTVTGSIFLNYILLKLFVEYLYFWPTIAKIFTTIFVVVYSYVVQRYYTFRTGKLKQS